MDFERIKFQLCFKLSDCCMNTDRICNTFKVSWSTGAKRLWTNQSFNIINTGTITVSLSQGGGKLDVLLNGNHTFSVTQGEIRSQTFEDLQSLEVRCADEAGICRGEYHLSLHQKHAVPFTFKEDTLECYLVDSSGEKLERDI
ncbi:S-Ena type endospore appendage [Halobacillus karajensis]|uniref:S-Ena type endospore appendage n=1 Tax=Halobacillus karajensis TaxID=195088 RepID=UPI000945C184